MAALSTRLLPTGDFLERLSMAEARDEASSRGRRGVQFHPQVVTRIESAWDVERTFCEGEISPYTEAELQDALNRAMVKMHIRECLRGADDHTRQKFNAISADEAWRRADALEVELSRKADIGDAAGGHVPQAHVGRDNVALKQRQRNAAMRCVHQAMSKAPKPQSIRGRPPLSSFRHESAQPRPPSARQSAVNKTPGKIVRKSSPRLSPLSAPAKSTPRKASPSKATLRPVEAACRTSTRVMMAPGGRSSIVFG